MQIIKFISLFIVLWAANVQGADANFEREYLNPDRVYLNEQDVKQGVGDDKFYIHQGHNQWISTSRIVKDRTGLYTNIANITKDMSPSTEYVRHWKCPYCFHHWPIGTPCQNKNCPSRYK